MKGNVCDNCGWFKPEGMGLGTCQNPKCEKDIVPLYGGCKLFSEKGKSGKVKPRRLCDFCERGKRMNSEEGEHDLRLVKLTPLPAINLTSGEIETKPEKPFYAMFLHDPEYGDEAATFQVKFCPICGRKLVTE